MSRVDAWGRTIVGLADIESILYGGGDIQGVLVDPSEAVERFNALCRSQDRPEFVLHTPGPLAHTPEEEHARRRSEWIVCEHLREVDVRAFLLSLCDNAEQEQRINEEMDLFEDRGLVPLLQTMMCLVDHFRQNKVVWGVGRGSSVASYALYRIGVHKIDPLKYGLDIGEFLK